jgi:hypothetical protein
VISLTNDYNTMTSSTSLNDPTVPDASPIEYRIAIADTVGNDGFRDVVFNSDSNTNGAIYFRKSQLIDIAAALPTNDIHHTPTNDELRGIIRSEMLDTHASRARRGVTSGSLVTDGGVDTVADDHSRFSFSELVTIADTLGAVPNPPYAEVQMRQLAGASVAGPYLSYLVEQSNVDLYLSANVGSANTDKGSRGYYPFRLEPVHEIPESADTHPKCCRYVVDSSVGKEDIENIDALDAAARVGADAVVLADEYQDMEGTVEAVVDGLTLYQQHDFNGEVIVPLQAPHGECYQRVRNRGVSPEHTFAIGGLKDCSDDERKLDAVREVRVAADHNITIHGLGYGVTDTIAKAVRNDEDLLDSVDYSTPVQNSIGGAKKGEERLCTVAAEAGAQLIEDLRRVSPLVDNESSTNASLSDF